jgi:spore germination cell wall hydrolase CwlJ-like protein
MSELTLPRPNLAAAPDALRHAPTIGLLAGVVALFASVGGGLPSLNADVAVPEGAGIAQAAPGEPPLPKPESDPTALLPITAGEAIMRNASLPIDAGPNPAAAAFTLPADEVARMRSVDCLTAAVYYEAAHEPTDGQRAVAQVVLNRVRHPHYPKSVCGVVFQGHQRTTGCQFTFTCDGSLRRTPAGHLWDRAKKVAQEALAGYVHRSVGWATHYHANYVFPYWAPSLAKVAQIGAHIFYRWDGYGRPGTNVARYAGAEPDIQWRGGFGQPVQTAVVAEGAVAATAEARDALAAAAAVDAQKEARGGTAFQRSILRRYEPVNTQQVLDTRAQAQGPSASSRWAITGRPTGAAETQRPLGRAGAEQPTVLEGVRRRPGSAEAAPIPAPAPAPSAK